MSNFAGLGDLVASITRTPEAAIAAGTGYLSAQQRSDGMWADFVLAPGESDEWVTGYVGSRLASIAHTEQVRSRAWRALVQRAHDRAWTGWGFSLAVPTDADSTAWALRLAATVDQGDSDVAQVGLRALDGFRDSRGAVSTYIDADPIRAFMGADAQRSFQGWLLPHACVTAAACAVYGDGNPLESMQLADGRWSSYWWDSDSFATALACEVAAPTLTSKAAAWACDNLVDGLGAFERSNLIAAAVLGGRADDDRVREAIRLLVMSMRPDGSWPPSAHLRVPDPDERRPESAVGWTEGGRIEGAVVVDRRALFTTATVVHALTLARAHSN